ncbi:MAG: hypothetical protein HXS53_03625 [Theionarchaea archaeon]|nr:hypothetical protein [Theionarchaea archaeon]
MCDRLLQVPDDLLPYVIFLPSDRDAQLQMLSAVFGSDVNLGILTEFCGKSRVYQKQLIETLPYSNKTLISHLKELVTLGVLREGMEKKEGEEKNVWLKYFEVEPSKHWLIFLIYDPQFLSPDTTRKLIREVAQYYFKKIVELARAHDISTEEIVQLFEDGIHERI